MPSSRSEFVQGVRLVVVAGLSAVLTAAVVIAGGQAWLSHATQASDAPPSASQALLVRTGG